MTCYLISGSRAVEKILRKGDLRQARDIYIHRKQEHETYGIFARMAECKIVRPFVFLLIYSFSPLNMQLYSSSKPIKAWKYF